MERKRNRRLNRENSERGFLRSVTRCLERQDATNHGADGPDPKFAKGLQEVTVGVLPMWEMGREGTEAVAEHADAGDCVLPNLDTL
jgi:hypothetical protein